MLRGCLGDASYGVALVGLLPPSWMGAGQVDSIHQGLEGPSAAIATACSAEMFEDRGCKVTSYTERNQVPEKLMDGTYVEGLCAWGCCVTNGSLKIEKEKNLQGMQRILSVLQVLGGCKMGHGGRSKPTTSQEAQWVMMPKNDKHEFLNNIE